MKNTILASIVAIICTAAICITCVMTFNASKKVDNSLTPAAQAEYLSEADAAEYIGVTDEVMEMLRKDLKYFEGSYMTYSYNDADGNLQTDVVYRKSSLDEAVKKYMDKTGALNFKYIQEQKAKSADNK